MDWALVATNVAWASWTVRRRHSASLSAVIRRRCTSPMRSALVDIFHENETGDWRHRARLVGTDGARVNEDARLVFPAGGPELDRAMIKPFEVPARPRQRVAEELSR